MPLLLGCIADDLTGATDLALTLQREGMRVVQWIGVPPAGAELPDADAVVIALKSRTGPAAEAVARSRNAAARLAAAGARQIYFKYCSTFDSTDQGNIGPVIEALLADSGAAIAVASPAFPATGRTVYQGHLFVGGVLLADTAMRHHPLTPMRDSNLVALLQRQTRLGVGLVPYATVRQGPGPVASALGELARTGRSIAIVDALTDDHLRSIGAAVAGHALVTGASGMALGLPANFRRAGLLSDRRLEPVVAAPAGHCAVLAGSCSSATLAQISAALAAGWPALRIDPVLLAEGRQSPSTIAAWIAAQGRDRPLVVYASAEPERVADAQSRLGRARSAALVEHALAAAADALVTAGARRLIVAGGETSGAVVERLGVVALAIGAEIDPGVPWTLTLGEPRLALALKSGNFGTPDFFLKAWSMLQ